LPQKCVDWRTLWIRFAATKPFRSRLAGKLRSPRPRKTRFDWTHPTGPPPSRPRRGGSSSSRGRIPEKKRRPGCGFARWMGPRPGAVRIRAGWRVGFEFQLQVPEAAGVPRASDGAGPEWSPKRRCGNLPSPCARLLTASGSRVRLSAFEENPSQPLCTGSHPERMRPHLWLLLRELLSCSERMLEAPGSGKTSRAISAKSAVLAPAARIFRPPPPTLVSYAGHAACGAVSGSETSDLLGPRPIAYDSTVLLESRSINRIFR
jgi:hypothetical protein